MIRLTVPASAPSWAHKVFRRLETAINRQNNPTAQRVPQYAVADKPDATAFEGHIIYITDTNRFAGSDGTNWVYLSDEVAV